MCACVMQMYACTLFRMLATFVCLCVCAHARKKHAHTRTPARTHAPTQKTRARARAHVQSAWESAGHRRENLRGSQHWNRPGIGRALARSEPQTFSAAGEIAMRSRSHRDLIAISSRSDLIRSDHGRVRIAKGTYPAVIRRARPLQSLCVLEGNRSRSFVPSRNGQILTYVTVYEQRLFYINCRAVNNREFLECD